MRSSISSSLISAREVAFSSGTLVGRSRVSADATAFAHRDMHSNMMCMAFWKSGEDGTKHIQWLRQ